MVRRSPATPQNVMLTRLHIQNFRCFRNHTVPFNAITIAIGRNNAGKSILVEALRLVAIVTARYRSLTYHDPPRASDIPRREVGVTASLKGMEFSEDTEVAAVANRRHNRSEFFVNFGGEYQEKDFGGHRVVQFRASATVRSRLRATFDDASARPPPSTSVRNFTAGKRCALLSAVVHPGA